MRQAGNYKDLTGQKFGELTVVAPTAKRKEGLIVRACRCSCGSYTEASRRQLNSWVSNQMCAPSLSNNVEKKLS